MMRITPDMPGDVKIKLCNEIVARHFLPLLENYHGRELTDREKIAVMAHINMLFMNPCPLDLLLAHDNKFAEAMRQPRN